MTNLLIYLKLEESLGLLKKQILLEDKIEEQDKAMDQLLDFMDIIWQRMEPLERKMWTEIHQIKF